MSANANRVLLNPCRRSRRLAAAAGLAVLLAAGAAPAAAPSQADGGVVLSCLAPDAAAVSVVGDFNSWNPDATPMVRGADGAWTVTVALPSGDHAYRFVIDGQWSEDPDNPARVADPFGGFNSVVTVGADGVLAGGAPPAPPAQAAAPAGDLAAGPPRAADGGVLFTYRDPAARQVFLAGSFNAWDAAATPMTRDAKGTWSVVRKLDAGRHTYKFVVDGNWVVDPENAATEGDGYGGSNSLLEVDAKGKLVAVSGPAPAAAGAASVSSLNAKTTVSGRYLTRYELARNVTDDPRYRLLRPSMSADLNFDVSVNSMVDAYLRLRMDSNENVILNNIVSNLDEAELHVHPQSFGVRAYWNREIFTSADPLRIVGDVDLPGTIGHDHLATGKGTAGALVVADPYGFGFTGFFANVHNADYYNDPGLFDNTGSDRAFLRLSRSVGAVEFGLPIWLQRRLTWFSFETLVGEPTTGIPALDDYLDRTTDSSTWFETESHDYQVGLDASLPLRDGTMRIGAQVMHVDLLGRFVTGNRAGQNNVNGSIDVPYLDRSELLAGLRWDFTPDDDTAVRLEHAYRDQRGAAPDQRDFAISYRDQSVAENRIYFTVADSPAQTRSQRTELEASRRSGSRDLGLYLWRAAVEEDYGAAGRTVPGDASRTDRTVTTWYLSGLVGAGEAATGFGHGELEFGVTLSDPDVPGRYYRSYEYIARYARRVSRHVTALADVRLAEFAVDEIDPTSGAAVAHRETFTSPFVGLQYAPLPNFELVLGYGVDPVDFSIDYSGRQLGRWWYRQRHLFDNPEATILDAERHLADARVFTLRAQLTF